MTTEQDLRAVLELSERATPGDFTVKHETNLMAGDGFSATSLSGPASALARNTNNAALLAAAVNLLRKHGSALLRAVEDARRYQWLRENESNREDVFLSYCREELDAAIDAAIEEGDQA